MVAKWTRETDAEFLAGYDPDAFPHPSLTVDVVVLTVRDRRLSALLTRRTAPPQKGRWALPGGFVGIDEGLDLAARRVLKDKGGLDGPYLEQLYTFGDPRRDPRTRVISVAYMALTDPQRLDRAAEGWPDERCVAALDLRATQHSRPFEVTGVAGVPLSLAFDHAEILGTALRRMQGKLDYAPVGFELLPKHFTLRQLQDIYEAVLGRRLNKDSFRRRMLSSGQLKATGAREDDVAYRPAELYRFVRSSGPQTARRR